MPRLTLQHYDIPNYAQMIPNKPRSERPIQKIADLLYVLHGIPWFKKKMEGGEGLATAEGNQGYDQTELLNDVSQGIVNDDLAQRATERARAADFGIDQGKPIELQLLNPTEEPLKREDFIKTALDDAFKKRSAKKDEGEQESTEQKGSEQKGKSPTKEKAEAYNEVFGDPGDELDLVFGDVFRESPVSESLNFREEQEEDLRRYLNNLKATEEMNGYAPADYSDAEMQDLWEREQGSDISHAKDLMEGYRGGESRW